MSGHFELGEIIKNHKDSDIGNRTVSLIGAPHFIFIKLNSEPLPVPLRPSVFFLESPKYVPRRKESSHTLPLPSQHSHPLLRANSENTMSPSDPPALPNKAATNPNPRQVPRIWTHICTESQDRPESSRLSICVCLQNQRRASIGVRSSSSPRNRTRSPSRGRGGQSDTEERHRQPRGRQG